MAACKILVVDDDDDIRDSLIGLFRGEGLTAEGAKSGVAALAMLTWGQRWLDSNESDIHLTHAVCGHDFRF